MVCQLKKLFPLPNIAIGTIFKGWKLQKPIHKLSVFSVFSVKNRPGTKNRKDAEDADAGDAEDAAYVNGNIKNREDKIKKLETLGPLSQKTLAMWIGR